MLRFNKILDVDLENLIAEVEVGVVVQDINDHIAQYGLIYPPDPGTVKTASLGGTIAENAGGLRGLKYGITGMCPGEKSYIVFSCKYGYDKPVAGIGKDQALVFEVYMNEIIRE